MHPTLFYIPEKIFGVPLFGFGIALAAWFLVVVAWLVMALRSGWRSEYSGTLAMMLVVAMVFWKVIPFLAVPGHGLAVRGYGSMMLLGVLAGGWLSVMRARRLGISPQMFVDFLLWGIFPGLISGRLWYVIQYWSPEIRRATVWETLVRAVNLPSGGLVMYGAFLGGVVGWSFYAFRYRLPMLRMLDIVAPPMLLGLVFGRIGCFMFGCCFGGVCDLPWAVQFPKGTPAWQEQIADGKLPVYGMTFVDSLENAGSTENKEHLPVSDLLGPVVKSVEPGSAAAVVGVRSGMRVVACNGYRTPDCHALFWQLMKPEGMPEDMTGMPIEMMLLPELPETDSGVPASVNVEPVKFTWVGEPLPERSLPVHPTQLYQAIDAMILCLFVLAMMPLCRRDGMQLAVTMTVYPVSRFLLERIRIDEAGQFGTSLSIGQWASMAILVAAAGLWVYIFTHRRDPAYRN